MTKMKSCGGEGGGREKSFFVFFLNKKRKHTHTRFESFFFSSAVPSTDLLFIPKRAQSMTLMVAKVGARFRRETSLRGDPWSWRDFSSGSGLVITQYSKVRH